MSSTNDSANEKDKSKKKDDEDLIKVHSANSWESADLGDDERRKKFLRLMGASKKEHHGRFIIGDKEKSGTHGRDKISTEEVNKELENQYLHSQEHKITRWSHTGLGFDDKKEEPKKEETSTKDQASDKDKDTNDTKSTESSSDMDKPERKRESSELSKGDQSPPKKPKLMSFVKSSD